MLFEPGVDHGFWRQFLPLVPEEGQSSSWTDCPFRPYGEEVCSGHEVFERYPLESAVRGYVRRSELLPALSDDALSVQLLVKRLPILARWVLDHAAIRSTQGVCPHESIEEMQERFIALGKVLKPESYQKALRMAERTIARGYGLETVGARDGFHAALQEISLAGVAPRNK